MIEEFREYSETPKTQVSCKEQGKEFLLISTQDLFYKVKVDGGLDNSQESKCDYLIIKASDDSIWLYVELKGKDIKKAFEQIEATHNKYKDIINQTRKFYGAIVASRVAPKTTTKQQILISKMKNKYKMECLVCSQKLKLRYNQNSNSIVKQS